MEYIEGIMYVCIGTMGAGGADTYFGTVDLGTGVVVVIGDTPPRRYRAPGSAHQIPLPGRQHRRQQTTG